MLRNPMPLAKHGSYKQHMKRHKGWPVRIPLLLPAEWLSFPRSVGRAISRHSVACLPSKSTSQLMTRPVLVAKADWLFLAQRNFGNYQASQSLSVARCSAAQAARPLVQSHCKEHARSALQMTARRYTFCSRSTDICWHHEGCFRQVRIQVLAHDALLLPP